MREVIDFISGNVISVVRSWIVLAFLAALITSCTPTAMQPLPSLAVQGPGEYRPGSFIWLELLTENAEAAQPFYEELFGWSFTAADRFPDYRTITHAGRAIGGMLVTAGTDPDTPESRWIGSISVSDVDETSRKAVSLGGTVLYGPIDSGERGRFAQIEDSQGADFVVLRAAKGDPGRYKLAPGYPVWMDLFTREKTPSETFYSGLLGYTLEAEDGAFYFRWADITVAGLVPISWTDIESTWLPYIGVSNLRSAVLKAIRLGGTLLAYDETAAVILDPSGAAIGLHLLPTTGGK
jgi:predicted enzyme related to lactoylglutathione lyase